MTDQTSPASTTVSTTPAALAGTPASSVPGAVNVAQLPGLQQQALPQGSPLDQPTRDHYEMRIRDLQSRADKEADRANKAVEERNTLISQYTLLQEAYTKLQQESTANLGVAADTSQQAINHSRQLEARVTQLEAELRRANVLLQFPDLVPYGNFIPIRGTEEEQKAAVQELQAIRQKDLERIQGGHPPFVTNPLGTPPQQQQQTPVAPSLSPVQALYGNRPTMNPFLPAQGQTGGTLPGSTPAALSPAGAGSTPEAINEMLTAARKTGDPVKFAEALEQAKVLANQSIQAML